MELVTELLAKYPLVPMVLSALGGLMVVGMGVVALTPSKDDDEWVAKQKKHPVFGKVISFLVSFSPIQKK